ncbi:MAG: HepT-like ribonuclease domain-containing protein [Pseudomarimonas sp.]
MSKAWQAYALHILDAINRIRLIESRGSIADDVVLYDAALRNLQTLSEATQRLPEALKEAHPHVPWRQISAFRNILVHNYLGDIDADSVAAVIREHLGQLKESVEAMLEGDSD